MQVVWCLAILTDFAMSINAGEGGQGLSETDWIKHRSTQTLYQMDQCLL